MKHKVGGLGQPGSWEQDIGFVAEVYPVRFSSGGESGAA